jgi:hypothetical protein
MAAIALAFTFGEYVLDINVCQKREVVCRSSLVRVHLLIGGALSILEYRRLEKAHVLCFCKTRSPLVLRYGGCCCGGTVFLYGRSKTLICCIEAGIRLHLRFINITFRTPNPVQSQSSIYVPDDLSLLYTLLTSSISSSPPVIPLRFSIKPNQTLRSNLISYSE